MVRDWLYMALVARKSPLHIGVHLMLATTTGQRLASPWTHHLVSEFWSCTAPSTQSPIRRRGASASVAILEDNNHINSDQGLALFYH